jgi:hypothetical protein
MKRPPNTPDRGDKVRLRGRAHEGVLVKYDPESLWSTVEWEAQGPKVCHLYELEKVA